MDVDQSVAVGVDSVGVSFDNNLRSPRAGVGVGADVHVVDRVPVVAETGRRGGLPVASGRADKQHAEDNDDGLVSSKEGMRTGRPWAGPRWVFGWLDSRTIPALTKGRELKLNIFSPENLDMLWMQQHSSDLVNR